MPPYRINSQDLPVRVVSLSTAVCAAHGCNYQRNITLKVE